MVPAWLVSGDGAQVPGLGQLAPLVSPEGDSPSPLLLLHASPTLFRRPSSEPDDFTGELQGRQAERPRQTLERLNTRLWWIRVVATVACVISAVAAVVEWLTC